MTTKRSSASARYRQYRNQRNGTLRRLRNCARPHRHQPPHPPIGLAGKQLRHAYAAGSGSHSRQHGRLRDGIASLILPAASSRTPARNTRVYRIVGAPPYGTTASGLVVAIATGPFESDQRGVGTAPAERASVQIHEQFWPARQAGAPARRWWIRAWHANGKMEIPQEQVDIAADGQLAESCRGL